MDFSLAALPHEACFLLSMGVSVYKNGTEEERAKFDGDEYFVSTWKLRETKPLLPTCLRQCLVRYIIR